MAHRVTGADVVQVPDISCLKAKLKRREQKRRKGRLQNVSSTWAKTEHDRCMTKGTGTPECAMDKHKDRRKVGV